MENKNQIERNYAVFKKNLPELLKDPKNHNKFSLWHDEKLIEIYDTESDAIKIGCEKFKEFGNFSIQQITKNIHDLGFHSLCL